MFRREEEAAKKAVLAAMQLARTIQDELCQADCLTKTDQSPVTIADFAVQALVTGAISSSFPNDPLVAEEEAACLRRAENSSLLEKIQHYLGQALGSISRREILGRIDRGKGKAAGRFWTIDPIDGTKGFLRSDQFAVALALIEEGEVVLGMLGCPRLAILANEESDSGFLLSATKNEGTWMYNASCFRGKRVHASTANAPRHAKLVESYESSHSDIRAREKIQSFLHTAEPPRRLDGQVKYCLVAAGDADAYLRIPHPAATRYREKIWDHAAGSLIVTEAGGRVTDIDGSSLDFTAGTALARNRGILASNGILHDHLLAAIAAVAEKPAGSGASGQ